MATAPEIQLSLVRAKKRQLIEEKATIQKQIEGLLTEETDLIIGAFCKKAKELHKYAAYSVMFEEDVHYFPTHADAKEFVTKNNLTASVTETRIRDEDLQTNAEEGTIHF